MKKLIFTVGALLLSTLGSATPANVTTADVSGNTWQFKTLACQIPQQKRKDCHRKSSNGIQCTSYGCCWDQGHKKCYEAKLMPAPPGCQNSNTNKTNWCKRSQTSYPPAVDRRVWQTPPQGEPDYRDSFKTYRNFQAYASIKYSNPSPYVRTATVEVITFKRVSNLQLLYKFEPYQSSWTSYDKITVTQDQKLPLKIKVFSPQTEETLELDEIYFTWMNPAVNAPHTKDGRKGAIVELFGWPFNDIAQECTMLGKAGYLGVRIWPPNEHIQSDHYLFEDSYNPWWVVYQPVSYRTFSRMGTRQELYNMIKTCREKGVRIYADAVLNHMSGGGNDVQNHRNDECAVWGPKNASAGSPYFTHSWTFGANRFTHQQPALEFPAVPFHASHFHCERAMPLPTTNGIELSAGWLLGLTDLNTEHPYVQQRLADYLTDLLSMGISGFRLDAAKHIKPASIAKIISLVRKNMGGTLPKDFLAYLEVTLYPEDWDFVACKYSEYSFYQFLDDQLKHYGLSPEERDSIKLWSADYPAFFPVCGKWILPQERFVIQNDDHDIQFGDSRNISNPTRGSILVKERNVTLHRHFTTHLFTRQDHNATIRALLSSYTLPENKALGFPDGKSDCAKYTGPYKQYCRGIKYEKAHKDVCGYSVGPNDTEEGWKEGKYTRVHRDRKVILAMRKWMGMKTDVGNEEIGLPSNCK